MLALLMVILFIAYFFGFFIDIARDSAKYAWIAREMAEKNHWFFLTISDEPYTQKPPFMFWLSAVSFRLLDISNFSFKLPSFIYAFAGIFAVYKLSTSMYGKKTAKIAVASLITSAIIILYSMDIHTDTVLFTNIALSLWFIYEYLEKKQKGFLIAAGLALGLSVLTKGIFGLLAPGFAALGYLASKNQWKKLIDPNWLILAIIVAITSLPVLIPLYIRNGFEGIWFFIWGNNFGRVIGKYNGIINDPTFYIHTLIYMFLPWTIVFIAGVVSYFQTLRKKGSSPASRFLMWGFIGVFIILTLSKNKLPNYILCIMPLASIITARGWETMFQDKIKSAWKTVQKITLGLLWVLMISVTLLLFPDANPFFWILFIALFGIFFWIIGKESKDTLSGILPTILTGVAIALLLNLNLAKKLFGEQAAVSAAKIINKMDLPENAIYYFNPNDIEYHKALRNFEVSEADSVMNKIALEKHFYLNYELMFYTKTTVGYINSSEKIDEVCDKQKVVLFTNENGKNILLEKYDEQFPGVTPLPDFNPAYPFAFLLQKTGRVPCQTKYLIEINRK